MSLLLKARDKQVKIVAVIILLVVIGLMLLYANTSQSKPTAPTKTVVNQTTTAVLTNTSTTTPTVPSPTSSEYGLSFYVKILKDRKIGKIYYKGIPPFYSIIARGEISEDKIIYLNQTYYYKILSLSKVLEKTNIGLEDITFHYYNPEKPPKGCESYGFNITSNNNNSIIGNLIITYCSYFHISSNQIYITGNATSNGIAGIIFFKWKQDKIFVFIRASETSKPPVLGDWFLQAVYKKEYTPKEPVAVKILLVNARPESLVDAYYNKDDRLVGVGLSLPNGTPLTGLKLGNIYLRRKLVYLDAIYDYTWYPTLAGMNRATLPLGEYVLHINYTIRTRTEDNKLENTTIRYTDKIMVGQQENQSKTIAGLLIVGKHSIILKWVQTANQNKLNITVTGPGDKATIKLQIMLSNNTVKNIERQLPINKSTIIKINGEVKAVIAQGTLPGNQTYIMTLPLKQ